MKTLPFYAFILTIFIWLLTACNKEDNAKPNPCAKNPCDNPAECPNQCPNDAPGVLDMDNIELDGDFTKAGNNLVGDGKITFDLSCNRLVFEVEDADLAFDSDEVFRGLTGKIKMPKGDHCFLLGPPNNPDALFQADVFFFSGKYINENYELAFQLEPDKKYFLLAAKSDLSLGLCEPGSTAPKESLTFRTNLGQLVWLLDPCDPLQYTDGRSDLIGGVAIGSSAQGKIRYVPDFPVTGDIESFGGKSIRYGAFSLKKVFKLEGTLIQSKTVDARLATDDFLDSELEVGYSAGFNGSAKLGLVLFTIPLAEASAGLQVKAGTGGAGMQVFLRGMSDPFDSWWPEFIPFKPISRDEIKGYYISRNNQFELAMKSKFGIMLPSGPSLVSGENSVETEAKINNEELSFARNVTIGDNEFSLQAVTRKNESELNVTMPPSVLDNLRNLVIERLDLNLEKIDAVRIDYTNAFADYNLALDLQGLRSQIPDITAEARRRVAAGVREGKAKAEERIPRSVCSGGLLCNRAHLRTQIYNWIDNIANNYVAVLNRVDAAVAENKDNDQTRRELEAALRALIAKRQLTGKKTFEFCVKSGACVNSPTSVTINLADYGIPILNDSEVDLLTRAANNVSRIPEASNKYLAVKAIYDQLKPEEDRIKGLRTRINEQLENLPSFRKLGFVKNHQTGSFAFYYETPSGNRVNIGRDFDPFAPGSFIDAYYELP